ncbi:MAG: protein kinase [Candidatus Wallbacteria bacterium]|nr:protein kinase [Candidatus Wallbacteria bacterium]
MSDFHRKKTLIDRLVRDHANRDSTRTDLHSAITRHKVGSGGCVEISEETDWEVGNLIDGKYEILEILGTGGMSVVYRILHREWDIELAVKTPFIQAAGDPLIKERFMREAQTWVDLGQHLNIVQCWYARELGGIPRLFMDFMGGGSLKDWIRQGRIGKCDWPEIIDVALQAAAGLEYAHQHGIVHRDIKPGNLLMTQDGIVSVTDFGIVKIAGLEDIGCAASAKNSLRRKSGLTRTGEFMGTPEYGSPEQWGDASRACPRTDIYALGIVLYELCCGRRPFDEGKEDDKEYDIILRHINTPPPHPWEFNREIPECLAKLILKCLSKKPEKRPSDMTEFRSELKKIHQNCTEKPYQRSDPHVTSPRADNLNNKAVSFYDMGRKKDAISTLQEALRLDPLHPDALFNKTLLEWREGLIDDLKACQSFTAVSHDTKTALYLASMHLERTDADESLSVLRTAFSLPGTKDSSRYWRALGDTLMCLGRYQAAAKAYGKTLSLSPGDKYCQTSLEMAVNNVKINDSGELLFPWSRLLVEFGSHDSDITAISLTADSRTIITGDDKGAICLWDLRTGKLKRTWDLQGGSVNSLSCSQNGVLLCVSQDSGPLLMSLDDKSCTVRLINPEIKANCAIYLKERQFVISGGADGLIHLYDCKKKATSALPAMHSHPVTALAVSSDERFVLSGSSDGMLDYWDIWSGLCLGAVFGHEGGVNRIVLTPDGCFALTCGNDCNLKLWDLAAEECVTVFKGHTGQVLSLGITPDGQYAVSCGTENQLRIWELASGRCLRTMWSGTALAGMAISVNGLFAVTSGNRRNLCLWVIQAGTRSGRCTLHVCRPPTREILEQNGQSFHALMAQALERCESGELHKAYGILASARTVEGYGRDPEAMALNTTIANCLGLSGLRKFWSAFTLINQDSPILAACISDDNRFAVTIDSAGLLCFWDVLSQTMIKVLSQDCSESGGVLLTADTRLAIAVDRSGGIQVWDLLSEKRHSSLSTKSSTLPFIALSSCGEMLLSANQSGGLILWNLEAKTAVRNIPGKGKPIRSLAIDRQEGSAFGAEDKFILAWKMPSLQQFLIIGPFSGSIEHIFAVREKILASTDNARLYAIDTAVKPPAVNETIHSTRITASRLTSDGRFAFFGDAEGCVLRWDTRGTGGTVLMEKCQPPVHCLGLSADNRYLFASGGDMVLRFWELDWDIVEKTIV